MSLLQVLLVCLLQLSSLMSLASHHAFYSKNFLLLLHQSCMITARLVKAMALVA